MTLNSKKIIDRYINWLKDNLKFKDISDDLVKIQTPFVDSHNDYIVIYIKKNKEEYILTDDGRTLFDLQSSGVSLTQNREKQLKEFVVAQGVNYDEKTENIFVITSWESLPQKKNDLIQAIINVGDMFLTAQANVKNLFYEEVALYFQNKNIAFSPNVYLEGGGGVKHKIDFIIGRVHKMPQLIRAVNTPSKTIFEVELFKYIDIAKHNTQYEKSEKIIFINDTEKEVKKEYIDLIKSHGITPVLWSNRETTQIFSEAVA